MSQIKVVSNKTIVKKIIVGTPVNRVKKVDLTARIENIIDINTDITRSDPEGSVGHVLVFDPGERKFVSQVLDGGNVF